MTGLPSSPIVIDEKTPTEPVVTRVTLVPDEHAGSSHTYNSKSEFEMSVWEIKGLPSTPIVS